MPIQRLARIQRRLRHHPLLELTTEQSRSNHENGSSAILVPQDWSHLDRSRDSMAQLKLPPRYRERWTRFHRPHRRHPLPNLTNDPHPHNRAFQILYRAHAAPPPPKLTPLPNRRPRAQSLLYSLLPPPEPPAERSPHLLVYKRPMAKRLTSTVKLLSPELAKRGIWMP